MRLTSYINNSKCLEWGINLNQGALFDLINQLHSWAEPIYLEGEVYYWASRQMICDELPLAYSKPDTVYRALKTLEEKELINYLKIGVKDCVNLTEKGKQWNSGINPALGNKSESTRKQIRKSSDLNPTYKTTNDHSTNDYIKNTKKEIFSPQKQKDSRFEEWYLLYPKKVSKETARKTWIRDKLDDQADDLINKLTQQIALDEMFRERKFIPHPSTYLNQKRYQDEIQKAVINATNQSNNQPKPVSRHLQLERRIMHERAAAGHIDYGDEAF